CKVTATSLPFGRLGAKASCVWTVSFFQAVVTQFSRICSRVGGVYFDKLNSVSIKENGVCEVLVLMAEGRTFGSADSRTCPKERQMRSEEHTSELQSRENLVCRLLLE